MDVDETPIPEADDPDTPPEIANDTVHEIRKTMDDAPQMVTNIIAYSHSSTNSNNFFWIHTIKISDTKDRHSICETCQGHRHEANEIMLSTVHSQTVWKERIQTFDSAPRSTGWWTVQRRCSLFLTYLSHTAQSVDQNNDGESDTIGCLLLDPSFGQWTSLATLQVGQNGWCQYIFD